MFPAITNLHSFEKGESVCSVSDFGFKLSVDSVSLDIEGNWPGRGEEDNRKVVAVLLTVSTCMLIRVDVQLREEVKVFVGCLLILMAFDMLLSNK